MTPDEIDKLINPPVILTPELERAAQEERDACMAALKAGKPHMPGMNRDLITKAYNR